MCCSQAGMELGRDLPKDLPQQHLWIHTENLVPALLHVCGLSFLHSVLRGTHHQIFLLLERLVALSALLPSCAPAGMFARWCHREGKVPGPSPPSLPVGVAF